MESLSIDIFERGNKDIMVNPDGLPLDNIKIIKEVALKVFQGAEKKFKCALHRCTFFAEPGFRSLSEIIDDYKMLDNPRIEGCDSNAFDQHYWVACDLNTVGDSQKTLILDPIAGYVGLQSHSKRHSIFSEYYERKRIVPPDKPQWEGGVRVKTVSL